MKLRVYRAETRPHKRFGVLFAKDPRGRSVYVVEDAYLVRTTAQAISGTGNFVAVDVAANRVTRL